MNPLSDDLLRVLSDRRLRVAVGTGTAVVYLSFVAEGEVGAVTLIASALLAVTIVLWRTRPGLSMWLAGAGIALGAIVVGVLSLLGVVTFRATVPNIGPYIAVVLPILGGALSANQWHRAGAIGLAVVSTVDAGVWAFLGGSGEEPLLLAAVVVCGAPLVAAWVWRQPDLRHWLIRRCAAVVPVLRSASTRTRAAVGGVVALYVSAVLLDYGTGSAAILVAGIPGPLALLWVRRRPSVALALTGASVAFVGMVSFALFRFGVGDAVLMLVAGCVLFLLTTGADRIDPRVAVGVGAAVLVGASIVGRSLIFGVFVALCAVVPVMLAWGWRWMRTAGHLRVRLTQSQAREQVVERDVLMEQERTRVARDVHDVVAHSLAVVIAQADGARYAAGQDPSTVGPALETIAETARSALVEVRTLLHDLRSSDHDGTLPGAEDVPALIEGVRALDVDVQMGTYGVERPLDPATGLALYRIVQEALTNALRHGAPGEPVDVDFDWGSQGVTLVVTNAVAPNVVPGDPGIGHGINGMRERAALAGGEVTSGVGSTGLFRLRAALPVQTEQPEELRTDANPAESLLQLLGIPSSA